MSTFGHPEQHEYHGKYRKYKERYRGIKGTPSIGGMVRVNPTTHVKGTCASKKGCNVIREQYGTEQSDDNI
jgi:hypothetical protein